MCGPHPSSRKPLFATDENDCRKPPQIKMQHCGAQFQCDTSIKNKKKKTKKQNLQT